MKDNKGFTLIELLAVVVILLAISVVAVSSISSAIERNKAKQNATKIDINITPSSARLVLSAITSLSTTPMLEPSINISPDLTLSRSSDNTPSTKVITSPLSNKQMLLLS